MRLARRLLIISVVSVSVALAMQWLLDVPAHYPGHGLEAIDPAMVGVAACLIDEIQGDPEAYGVGPDFELSLSEANVFKLKGWIRASTLISSDDKTLIVESDTNPLADPERIPTMCGAF